MKKNSSLEYQLKKLGFAGTLSQVRDYANGNNDSFEAYKFVIRNNDHLAYTLSFEQKNNEWKLKGYHLIKTSIEIPAQMVQDIIVNELEQRFKKADKIYNNYYAGKERKNDIRFLEKLEEDLFKVYNSGEQGKKIASLLMIKYWPESEYGKYVHEGNKLKAKYETELRIDVAKGEFVTASEAYKRLKQIEVLTKEHAISDEVLDRVNLALSKGEHFMAYNNTLYFVDKDDVYFFRTREEANEFAAANISDHDNFSILHFNSLKDVLEKIPYGEALSHQLKSDPDANGLYNKDGNAFSDALIEHIELQQLSLFDKQLKTSIMNNENFQYLTDNIKYMGFGETLKAELERNMKEGKGEFQVHFKAEINKKPFEATLNFRKSDSSDMYFFNNYNASLEKSNGEKNEQTFYLNKGKGVTAKEAYNLLDGRAVHKDLVTKEGQPYKAWIQLDFEKKDKNNNFEVKQFHENYGYDLKAAVEKFAVAELNDPEKTKALMQSLEKGNVQSVTIEKDGSSHKMFMEADPQFKKVTLYDSNMKMVAKESLDQYKAGIDKGSKEIKEDIGNNKKKDLKQGVKPEKEKLEKKNGQSLLPKKRESRGKGLGVS
ncbi:MAG: hypothetical protein EKK37_04495 [Sphingobacteriales bacterium]|jgi:hypothetical protein|nr:MAG: hypothetical protein EKK37_04495 [Sphingobacteriales bacterium]